jgi:hypothetical protein
MTNHKWKKWTVSTALLSVATAGVLAGCNNDDDGGPAPQPVPINTATPRPTATATVPGAVRVPVNFGNGQTGVLNLRPQGSTITGSLEVGAVLQTTRASWGRS